jgi:hypothetical protein
MALPQGDERAEKWYNALCTALHSKMVNRDKWGCGETEIDELIDYINHLRDPDEQSLLTEAIGMHEIYSSYLAAGFTQPEAMELLKTMIAASR